MKNKKRTVKMNIMVKVPFYEEKTKSMNRQIENGVKKYIKSMMKEYFTFIPLWYKEDGELIEGASCEVEIKVNK